MNSRIYKSLFMFFLFAAISLHAQLVNNVTFRVDMSGMIEGGFDPATDSIMIEGLTWDSFGVTLESGNESRVLAPETGNPEIYTTTITINGGTAVVGDSLRWKFFTWPADDIIGGSWEGGFGDYDGRPYFMQENNADVTLDPVTPNYQFIVVGLGIQNTVHFMADLTDLAGTGVGYFDPTIDNVVIEGLVWDNQGSFVVEGDRQMTQNPLLPGMIFETTLVIELDTALAVGDSLRWKFHLTPDARWGNSGWEVGQGRYYVFQEDGATAEVGPSQPAVFPITGDLTQDARVLFKIDMNNEATNRYDSSFIPLEQVQFVTVRGSHPRLGSWSGNWTEEDTVDPGVPVLNDSGYNGDETAGDNIWSGIVVFEAGMPAGGFTYKYGCYYPGCEDIFSSYYMDSFGFEGDDILFNLKDIEAIQEISDVWPNHNNTTSVEQVDDNIPADFTVEQNYPNPFNPSTVIRYRIDKTADITVTVYSLLGERITMDAFEGQEPGTYDFTFDGSGLASGMYIYNVSNGYKSVSGKMLLLK